MKILFWGSLGLIVYVYAGYPLLLYLLGRLRPAHSPEKTSWTPSVSLIIPAHNEEKVIADKIRNSILLDYPHDHLEIIVASDGSIDGTDRIVKEFTDPRVRLVKLERRGGKSLVENAAVNLSKGEVICFTDASIRLERTALRRLVSSMRDPEVGCVFGKVSFSNEEFSDITRGEGAYYRYELWIREMESLVGNLTMATGSVMCIKRNLFTPLNPEVGEDFVLPIQFAMRGYRTLFEKEARAHEVLGQSWPESMYRSKVRVIAKDLRGLLVNREILNPFRYPLYAWSLLSHKLARWLIPYFLVVLFSVNLLLMMTEGGSIYSYTFYGQLLFYLVGLIGFFLRTHRKIPFPLSAPFFFCLVNGAAFAAVAKCVSGQKFGIWQPYRDRFD